MYDIIISMMLNSSLIAIRLTVKHLPTNPPRQCVNQRPGNLYARIGVCVQDSSLMRVAGPIRTGGRRYLMRASTARSAKLGHANANQANAVANLAEPAV